VNIFAPFVIALCVVRVLAVVAVVAL